MNFVHPNLRSGIHVVLFADETEFTTERSLINDVLYPMLRKYFMTEFQIDFNIIDFYSDSKCKNMPKVEWSTHILSEMKNAHRLSDGLSSVIFLGERCGELRAPKSLTNSQFTHVLNYLQSKKDPSWKTFSSKYNKSRVSDDYLLEENISDEEASTIIDGIDMSLSSKPIDVFPDSFIWDYLTTDVEKCFSVVGVDRETISTTQVFHRITVQSYTSPDSKSKTETSCQKRLKEKYEAIIKTTRKKFLPNNFTEYSVNNMTLLDAARDLRTNVDKLNQMSELSNVFGPKSRSLTKDFRVSSTSDTYMQIFIEHVCKIIRENCWNLVQKQDVANDALSIESFGHIKENDKIKNQELMSILQRDREREKTIVLNYINTSTTRMPGLIFGPVGSGKTTLLLDLVDRLETKTNTIRIIRHCGRTACSSNLQLLICSISDQINAAISKKTVPNNSCEYAVCVYDLWTSLNKAGSSRSIIIFLDDVESLYPNSHTDMVKWLPPTLPQGVKIIMTSSSESFYQGFKKRYEVSNIININKTDAKECIKLLPSLVGCSVSDAILSQSNFSIQENSTPLFLQLLAKTLPQIKDPNLVSSDLKALFKMFVEQLKTKPDQIFVKHILSYLALSRFGLSLSELIDILSLDNRILLFLEFKTHGIFKFPAHLVLYYLKKCEFVLSSVQTNGKLLLKLKHQIYVTAIVEHHMLYQEDGQFFYQTLYDYWTSRYCGEKLKPTFEKASDDDDDSVVDGSHIYIKRFVSSQPYYNVLKGGKIVSNERKLLELPYLLIKFEKINELYKLVVFNFEYLFATLHQLGINQLISELYFTRQINEIKNNTELELLLAQLRLLSPEVIADAKLLAPEMSGRLCHLVGSNSLISQLHLQIDCAGTKINAISAVIPCYPTIDIENMKIELDTNNELLFSTLSPDNRFIATLINNQTTKEVWIIIWDSKSATKSQIINLGKFVSTRFLSAFYMPQSDEFVLVNYEDSAGIGFLIVNLEFSSIESTIKLPKNCGAVRIEYLSKSHLYLHVKGETQVYTHPSGQKDINLSKQIWPTLMTPNDRYLIGPKPVTKKATETNKKTFNLRVMNMVTGEVLCQLYSNMPTACMLANVRNEVLFVGTKTHGIIHRFDIAQIAKKDARSLKNNLELKLSEQSSLSDDVRTYMTKFYPSVKVTKFHLSVDERFLISEYIFNDTLRAFGVWNIANRSLVMCDALDISTSVGFSTDGQYAYYYQRNGSLYLLNLTNGTEYRLLLKEAPQQLYMLRDGSFFMLFSKSVKLATLKALVLDCDDFQSPRTFVQQYFHTSIHKPKLSQENVVIYSNNEGTSDFLYFKLTNNNISTMNISHSNESLTEFSTDRFLSPDGEKLLLVFGFKLASLMITEQESDVDALTIKTDSNGHVISNINDYRKPQIPRENYFTGNNTDSKKPQLNRDAYDQKIIKIINLKSSAVFFQVSLTGEQILKFTNTLLLTFKPDYASLTRSSENAFDIVSIYDVVEDRFVSSLYFEHPVVDSTLLQGSEDRLLICCGYGGKLLKLLGGSYFSTVLYEINVQTMLRYYDEFARSSSVTKIFTFAENTNGLLLQYSWLDSTGAVKIEKDTYYASIDTVKKEIRCQFTSQGKITDVSSCGTLGIDSLFHLYDLLRGNISRNMCSSIGRTEETNTVDCVNLFSRDSSYIVTMDPENRCLWVIRNDDQCYTVGKALLSTTLDETVPLSKFKMELASDGQLVIVYNDREFKIFVVKMTHKALPYDNNYKSNIERIKKILLP